MRRFTTEFEKGSGLSSSLWPAMFDNISVKYLKFSNLKNKYFLYLIFTMPAGIFVFQVWDRAYSFVMADDTIYDGLKESHEKHGYKIFGGRKNIPIEDLDRLANGISILVNRYNAGEKLDLKKELGLVLK
jgi:hypothetical protein